MREVSPISRWIEKLWRQGGFSRLALRKLLELSAAELATEDFAKLEQKWLDAELPAEWKQRLRRLQAKPYQESEFPYLTFQDVEYPERLRHLTDAPFVVYWQGREALLWQTSPVVAVVGTRKASSYARRVTAELLRAMAPYRPVVVSGMADGIDGVALRTALELDCGAIGVLGTSLKDVYPSHHRKLQEQMGQRGLLVSENFPETVMGPWRFLERNRIIAALSQVIVIVEAPERSGALSTANFGLELGREIFVVPGAMDQSTNRGGHRLIQQGAHLLMDVEEIFDFLKCKTFTLKSEVKAIEKPSVPQLHAPRIPELDPSESEIRRFLSQGSMHVDKMVTMGHFSISELTSLLMKLSLKGYVQELHPGVFQWVE